jgi:serine protease
MRKLFWVGLFLVGIIGSLWTAPQLSNRGDYNSLVLDFRDDVPVSIVQQQLTAIAQQTGQSPHLNSEFSTGEQLYVLDGDRTLLKTLRRSPLMEIMEAIEPNFEYHTLAAPNDPDYGKQWNLRSINVEAAWKETQGEGITVAVIDTGITPVPDLEGTSFTEGYDFVNDRTDALDDNGHGTHVAGTIAQTTNNNYGVAGIAYKATLMPIKVLDQSGSGTIADIAEAIRFAADQGADVINMSLGGFGDSQALQDAIAYAHQKNVVLVAAAGNANANSAAFPARYPNVIAVSALDAAGVKAPYSNFGAGVDLAAPGGSRDASNPDSIANGILQETIDPETGLSSWRSLQGTSMATPHVAAVAAMLKAVGIDEPDEVASILKSSARSVQDDPLNHYGAGQLDAGAAVDQAIRGQLSFKDFFRWLNRNGYLSLRFWFDGGIIALWPKVLMVVGSYLLAWLLRTYLPGWGLALSSGLVFGSSGLFFLRGFYVYDLPQWPFRVMGSSVAELGTAIQGSTALNPIFASALIPLGLLALLLGHPTGRLWTIGIGLGMASGLAVTSVVDPQIAWLGDGAIARGFLLVNAGLCFAIAYLAAKTEVSPR